MRSAERDLILSDSYPNTAPKLFNYYVFARDALPYWIERAESMEKALAQAGKYLAEFTGSCPFDAGLDPKYNICIRDGCKSNTAICWKKYFLEKDDDEEY